MGPQEGQQEHGAARAEPAFPGLAEPEELVELVLGRGWLPGWLRLPNPPGRDAGTWELWHTPGSASGTIPGSWAIPPLPTPAPAASS